MPLLVVTLAGCQWAADGQNLQGVRMFQQGQYQPALLRFQQALASDPYNDDAHYNLAAALHRLGTQKNDSQMLERAEQLYNQCLDLNPNHTDCYRGLAVLLAETDRSDSAFRLLKNWANSQPNTADARIELARLYEEFGDLETAKLHLNEALLVDQSNHRAWAALGHIREELGDSEQALANYQRSLNLNHLQPGVAQRVAALNRGRGTLDISIPGDTRTVNGAAPGRY